MGAVKEESLLRAFAAKGGSSEARFAADRELEFWIKARRNRLVAEWAAGIAGFDPEHVPVYLLEIIDHDLKAPGPDAVVGKLMGDLAARGIAVSEAAVRAKVREFDAAARAHYLNYGF